MNIKLGQILKVKNSNDKRKVLAIFCGNVLLSSALRHDRASEWHTFEEIIDYYELPKEKWKPKEGDRYYYFDDELKVRSTICQSPFDETHLFVDNCFKTEVEADAVIEKIKKILAE